MDYMRGKSKKLLYLNIRKTHSVNLLLIIVT